MGKGNQKPLLDVTASYTGGGKALWVNLRVCSDKFLNPFRLRKNTIQPEQIQPGQN
jgi:hypothetical protein